MSPLNALFQSHSFRRDPLKLKKSSHRLIITARKFKRIIRRFIRRRWYRNHSFLLPRFDIIPISILSTKKSIKVETYSTYFGNIKLIHAINNAKQVRRMRSFGPRFDSNFIKFLVRLSNRNESSGAESLSGPDNVDDRARARGSQFHSWLSNLMESGGQIRRKNPRLR